MAAQVITVTFQGSDEAVRHLEAAIKAAAKAYRAPGDLDNLQVLKHRDWLEECLTDAEDPETYAPAANQQLTDGPLAME